MFWLLLSMLVLVVSYGFYRSKLKPQRKRKPKLAVNNTVTFPIEDFRGNSIELGECACDAVKQFDGKRFLVHETPALPVDGCNSSRCTCRYIHLDDRRAKEGDRRYNLGLATQHYEHMGNEEKRFKKDRRRA